MRKLFASSICAVVLGLQAWAIIPVGRGTWYWPFMDYPMYSRAHPSGVQLVSHELRVTACEAPDTSVELTGMDLGLKVFRFLATLSEAAATMPETDVPTAEADSIVVLLSELIGQIPTRYCTAEVRAQTWVIDEQGLHSTDAVGRTVRAWDLPARRSEGGS